MWTIRDVQLEALGLERRADFEEYAFEHLRTSFSGHYANGGPERMRAVIRYGVERGSRRGFTTYRGLCTYITLMLWLGAGFDEDPLYPWAAALLGGGVVGDEDTRAEALENAALRHLDQAEGRDNEHLTAALDRLERTPLERLLPERDAPLEVALAARLRELHPQKCTTVGDGAVQRFVATSTARAAEHGLVERAPCSVFVGFSFFLGAHADEDPWYPWLKEGLAARRHAAPMTQAVTLHRMGLAYLRTVLAPV